MPASFDEKALLVLLTIVFLALQFVFYMITRSSTTTIINKMDAKFEKILERFDDRTKDLTDEIHNKRDSYAVVFSQGRQWPVF